MRLLDLYIGKTILISIIVVITGLVGLDMVFSFIDELEDVQREYQVQQVFEYVFMSLPQWEL